jgi:hypothetical protein
MFKGIESDHHRRWRPREPTMAIPLFAKTAFCTELRSATNLRRSIDHLPGREEALLSVCAAKRTIKRRS